MRDAGPTPGFDPLAHPVCFRHPRWNGWSHASDPWISHLPFAFLIVDLLKPDHIVDASAARSSFPAFCQAIDDLNLPARCVRIDREGDALETPDSDPADRHRFAKRITATHEDAISLFPAGSVDLLHLDRLPDGEANRDWLDSWIETLSPRGVLLIHETAYPHARGHRLWEDLRSRHPSLHFDQGNGLGALFVGGELPTEVRALVDAATRRPATIERFFSSLGESLELRRRLARLEAENSTLEDKLSRRERALSDLRWHREENENALATLRRHTARIEAERSEMLLSRAWRVTAPLRSLNTLARNAVRALRRRRTSFSFHPESELVPLSSGPFNWSSFGADPRFSIVPIGGRIPSGWTRLSVALDAPNPEILAPRIYFDDGQGYREENSIALFRVAPGRFEAYAHLAAGIRRLRFDPIVNPGPLRVGRLRCREISLLEAGFGTLWPHLKSALRSPRDGVAKARRLVRAWRQGGRDFVWLQLRPGRPEFDRESYSVWVRAYDTLGPEDREAHTRRFEALRHKALISVVMPVYNPDLRWLRRAIESVLNQWYPRWELCIADDASTEPGVREFLESYASKDDRIRLRLRRTRGNIAVASNSALEVTTGEFVALLDHDDELRPHALGVVAEQISRCPGAEIIYSDEDKIDDDGMRFGPYFKSDWNPDLFYSQNFVNHLGVYRKERIDEVGGFREGYEGAQDYDLILRLLEKVSEDQIHHIPSILYHWRAAQGSTSLNPSAKGYAHEAGRRALRDHFAARGQRGVRVEAAHEDRLHHRVVWPTPKPRPLVSIVIPTRDRVDLLRKAVASCFRDLAYEEIEVLIVDHQSEKRETREYFESLRDNRSVRILPYRGVFNFSAINNFAIAKSSGELILLLNNDVEAESDAWLRELVSHAVRPDVGAVGAMLYYPNNEIQHAGVVLGIGGVAGHAHKHLARGSVGHGGRARLVQNVSAVTGACLMMRREIFREVGPLDEESLPVAFNDIDLCLRIREAGYRIVWTPFAEFIHRESASRGDDLEGDRLRRFQSEVSAMKDRWGEALAWDPHYNPNLTIIREDFSLSFPPRSRDA